MFGRISRPSNSNSNSNKDQRPETPLQDAMNDDDTLPQRASSLIGGSGGVSLDGESLIMPPSPASAASNSDYRYQGEGDEGSMSSMNTSTYGGMVKNEFKILGVADHDYDSEMGMDRGMDIEGDTDQDTIPPRGPPLSKKQQRQQQHPYHQRIHDHPNGFGAAAAETSPARGDSRTKTSQSKNSTDSQEKGGGAGGGAACIPMWITEAPVWLKLIIVVSTALLVGAIVLIGVGAALAIQEDNSSVQSRSTNNNDNNNDDNSSPTGPTVPTSTSTFTLAPVMSPTPTPTRPPTMAPTLAPIAPGQTRRPTRTPTMAPTMMPVTQAPIAPGQTKAPTPLPTMSPTPLPSMSPTPGPVTFFITAGRYVDEDLAQLPEQLQQLPTNDGNTVMFHLGDWNSPFQTQCSELSYQENQALYSLSTVPVYFVPGDNEYNDCPDPELALDYWYTYNSDFETKFWPAPTEWNITRQVPFYQENFAYTHQGILFVGINLVGGRFHNAQEWQDRHRADLAWISAQYQEHVNTTTTMVVLAHSAPLIVENAPFFTQFLDDVQNAYVDIQVLFIHRNLGENPWRVQPQYNGIDNLMVVVVRGSSWPPMLVEIDATTGVSDFDQDDWYNDYIEGRNNANSAI